MLRFLFSAVILFTSIHASAQRLQGALRVTYGMTMLSEENSVYDQSKYKLDKQWSPGLGVQLNYLLNDSWELSSGFGIQYRKILFTHHTIDFPNLVSGSTYIKAKFSALNVPFLVRYKIPVGQSSLIIPSAGIVGSLFWINPVSAVGYTDLQYAAMDSLFYDLKAGGSFVKRFSADPFVSLCYEKQKDGLKVFGVGLFYQYTIANIPTIDYTSEFQNQTEKRTFNAKINGNLFHAGVMLTYYPSFLTFRKSETDDAYDEDDGW